MKILSLELKGAIRLELSGIKKITITPETSIMAVIGSNGSGKSSLLHYLSPMLADKSDFSKDGYKKIRVEHNNRIYCLTSDFSINKHSFVDEGLNEELNIGGTATMQKQLIKDYFNYTDKIHLLLTGKERFTQMSPVKRKEWFTMLCDSDYTFAINTFNKAKDKLRDATGALKKMTQHQIQLTSTNVEENELANINASINEHNLKIEELNKIIGYKDAFANPNYNIDLENNLSSLVNKVEPLNRRLVKSITDISNKELTPEYKEEIIQRKLSLEKELEATELLYSHLIKEYSQMENKISQVKITSHSELESTRVKIEELTQKKNELEKQIESIPCEYPITDLHLQKEVLVQGNPDVLELLHRLSLFGDEDITRDSIAELVDKIDSVKKEQSNLTVLYNRIDERIKHLEQKEKEIKILCPNCSHEFHPGFDKEKYDLYLKKREEVQDNLDKITSLIKDLEEQYVDKNTKYTILKDFSQYCRNQSNVLNQWCVDVIRNKLYLGKVYKATELYNNYKDYVVLSSEIDKLNQEIRSYQQIIDNANQVDEKEHHLLTEQLNKMSSQLEEVRRKKQSIIIHLESIEDILHYYNEFEEAKDSLQTTLDDIDDIQMKLAEYDIYTLVSGLIAEERNQVAILTKKQIEIITREKNIEMVNKQIEDIKQEIESWSAIVDTLNPQDGLIAEGLLGYIKIFLARMNGFIQSIWSYPLIIHPAKMTDGESNDELSYRFPMTVGLSEKPKTDISLGSDGILEIIDLAFKMIAMKALGLSGYPIFLDEFGRTFDAKHRENALKLIEKLSEEFIEDQIFIVSHNFMEYSVLNDVSFCVLSEDNIVLPPNNLNRGVEIIR